MPTIEIKHVDHPEFTNTHLVSETDEQPIEGSLTIAGVIFTYMLRCLKSRQEGLRVKIWSPTPHTNKLGTPFYLEEGENFLTRDFLAIRED